MFYKFLLFEFRYNFIMKLNIINSIFSIVAMFLHIKSSIITGPLALCILMILLYIWKKVKIYKTYNDIFSTDLFIRFKYDKELNKICYNISIINYDLYIYNDIELTYKDFKNNYDTENIKVLINFIILNYKPTQVLYDDKFNDLLKTIKQQNRIKKLKRVI